MWHFQHHHHTITIQVFHKHYYDNGAQVKCSLSRSDDDLNRFLTSCWFIPHTNDTHQPKWATSHHIALSRTNLWIRQASPILEDHFGDRGIQGIPRLRAAPSSVSSTITNTMHASGQFSAWIVFRLHGPNNLSLQLSVGHAFNMTRGPSTIGP